MKKRKERKKAIDKCFYCGKKFYNKRDRYFHVERWGCKYLYDDLSSYAAPLCACGCGQKVKLSSLNRNRYNMYVTGHNRIHYFNELRKHQDQNNK